MSSSSSSVFVRPEYTRLVTIAAHVDHGKTTLADNLIESNGLISERAAGTLRYLDSDPEEQRRGITMRTSAIGLSHRHVPSMGGSGGNKNKSGEKEAQKMIVHLLDSPGHTDFSREVSSSMLACDGAILVVDAVEGMGARTQQVFRETETYQLTPILVINKIDRLHTDLCLSPTEAYLRLRTLLETVNAAASSMVNSALQSRPEVEVNEQLKEEQEKLWTFDPAAGNVIFASALFGWGFTVQSLCRSLFRSGTIPIKPLVLKSFLFGDYKLKDDHKVVKWKPHANDDENVPIFAKFALQPIWDIYDGVSVAAATVGLGKNSTVSSSIPNSSHPNSDKRIRATTVGMDNVLTAVQIGTTLNSQQKGSFIKDAETLQEIISRTGAAGSEDATLRAILRRYRPLADSVLDVVCDYCPSPAVAASKTRAQALALQIPAVESAEFDCIRRAVRSCDDSDVAPCVAYICKFLSTDPLHVRDSELPPSTDGDSKSLILGLCRVLSGHLRTGAEYFVFGPKQDCEVLSKIPTRKVRLYLLMGSSFVNVSDVPAGHLCAVYGLEDVQFKTATLSSSAYCQPLCGFAQGIRPLVKVSIEPEMTSDAEYLERGLTKLSLADAGVEVSSTAKGERLLACLGELHLEQSILDLERVYCGKEGMKLRVSDPIVEFAESTTWFSKMEIENYTGFFDDDSPVLRQATIPPYSEEEGIAFARNGRMRVVLSGRGAALSLRVLPLLSSVYKCLKSEKISTDEKECREELLSLGSALQCNSSTPDAVLSELKESILALNANECGMICTAGIRDGITVRGVVSSEVYYPVLQTKQGNNEVSDEETPASHRKDELGIMDFESLRSDIKKNGFSGVSDGESSTEDFNAAAFSIWLQSMKGSVAAGFETAMSAGPICEEPVRNVLVILEGVEIAVAKPIDTDKYRASKPIAAGMMVSSLRVGVRCALLSRPVRLMERHLRLTLHSSLAGLGSLYQVLSKRRGKVIEDSMVDGTDLLMITALIPQAEAFGLTPELFSKTSGEVTAPEMLFSHWECLDVDPFWIPTSEEEREDFGELQTAGDASTGLDNTALSYIRRVRKRKGLTVDSSRTVISAEKQRTLKR